MKTLEKDEISKNKDGAETVKQTNIYKYMITPVCIIQ